MVVNELIETLSESNNCLPILAKLGNESKKHMYVDIFGNSLGLPTIYLSEDEPIQGVKKCSVLLRELERWRANSIHYHLDNDVYLIFIFEYKDESHDYRYFKLEGVAQDKSCVMLIASSLENKQLREHKAAFDENMYSPD